MGFPGGPRPGPTPAREGCGGLRTNRSQTRQRGIEPDREERTAESGAPAGKTARSTPRQGRLQEAEPWRGKLRSLGADLSRGRLRGAQPAGHAGSGFGASGARGGPAPHPFIFSRRPLPVSPRRRPLGLGRKVAEKGSSHRAQTACRPRRPRRPLSLLTWM